ncbi:MAG TPA: NIL domain-containing protein [Chthonomonadales bacterium]|nr:NIL domain-containing protein [Chthonomonadales bacterium]
MAVITVHVSTRTPEQVREPILYRLGKDFHVVYNVRRARISEESGFVEIEIEGALEEVQRAISWLHTTGLSVDARQRSVGDGSNL